MKKVKKEFYKEMWKCNHGKNGVKCPFYGLSHLEIRPRKKLGTRNLIRRKKFTGTLFNNSTLLATPFRRFTG